MSSWLLCLVLGGGTRAGAEPADEAWPMVGTGGHGHTYPGATVPFGFVQLSPDTRTQGWDACAGYQYADREILGFSHTHLSGTGVRDLGDLLVMPIAGPVPSGAPYVPLAAERFKSPFTHETETAQPGYYRVQLDRYGVVAELTATAHAGMHRYAFPAAPPAHLLLDLVHGIGNTPTAAELKVENDRLVTGFRTSNGWTKGRTVYFALECSRPFAAVALESGGRPLPPDARDATGPKVRGRLDFGRLAGPLIVRVGLSPTSVDEALRNLRAEIPTWDFDAVRRAARKEWNDHLSRIQIGTDDPGLRRTFYSALYHTMTAPTLYNNADNSYEGADQATHSATFQNYSTFSLWDTFRAEHPLLTVIEPARTNDFVNSMLAFARESPDHELPMWPLGNHETWCMIGYHAVPVIADAYAKGFRGFDASQAYAAMRATAMADRNLQDLYRKYGYVPAVTAPPDTPRGRRTQAASRTLEYAYDDWCIAQLAKALGHADDARVFGERAENFRNLFDPQTRFFRGRLAEGAFREPFNPTQESFDDFTEADAWQYAFAAPQDVPGMIRLYGGPAAFCRKLDAMFAADSDEQDANVDISGLIGQYAHGNEPCHHFAYLYALAGEPYQTQRWVRDIMETQYEDAPDGLDGNDDCGQMSAWYVWSAIGLYPVNPASGVYVIGSPLVEKAAIRLDPTVYPGGTFTIVAHDESRQNAYVQWAKLNGRPLEHPWITHAELVRGGTLELQMGRFPNKAWGAPGS
ncbi:MAG TPA: GH92 family glycosyl hydrolase [Opitutaceae bacterium]|nr:GH92 family glycosyl hydrolase [Opitutaceae bacterium]